MWESLTRVPWIDAADVLIVAFAVYQLLLALRGTRALHMVVGLLALYAVSWGALQVGLFTLNWILQYLLTAGFVLIVIVFQPEIRRALAIIGRRGFLLRPFARHREAHMIDEVVRAAASLAGQRMGALLVLERSTRLTDYIEAGVAVDGVVSRRLLESLFHPRTPLHDGAAILSEGRLAAASCVLPLSLNPDVSRELGTRHRAAIGLTEETDAVAVVVSEETGAISLAVGGEIEAVPDPEVLRRRLTQLVGAPGPPDGAHAPGKAEAAPAGREAG
jgi:diadenylate cyclase